MLDTSVKEALPVLQVEAAPAVRLRTPFACMAVVPPVAELPEPMVTLVVLPAVLFVPILIACVPAASVVLPTVTVLAKALPMVMVPL